MNEKEIVEFLADGEHERWARWQRYLHSVCVENKDGSLTIPKEKVDRWTRQMNMPYSELTEKEKNSDRELAIMLLNSLKEFIKNCDENDERE